MEGYLALIKEQREENEQLKNQLQQKDKEIERLKKDNEYLNKVNIELSTEKNRLNNKLKDIKSQLDYLETYSSKEDVFEDMKRRLDRINKIIGSDRE